MPPASPPPTIQTTDPVQQAQIALYLAWLAGDLEDYLYWLDVLHGYGFQAVSYCDPPPLPPPQILLIDDFGPTPCDHCQWYLNGKVVNVGGSLGATFVWIEGDGVPGGGAWTGVDEGGGFEVCVELATNTTYFPVCHVYKATAWDDETGAVSLPVECEINQAGQPPPPPPPGKP